MAVVRDELSNWLWVKARRPFFRLWSPFLEAVRSPNNGDIKLSDIVIDFPDDVYSIALEMPIENPTMFGDEYLKNILVTKFDSSLCPKRFGDMVAGECLYNILLFFADTTPDSLLCLSLQIGIDGGTKDKTVSEHVSDFLKKKKISGNRLDLCHYAMSIAIFVGLVSKMKSDKSLLTPVLIRKLQAEWEQAQKTQDAALGAALIEKSKRNGVYGWDVGKNQELDPEQIEQMRKEAINAGMKAPHWRKPHFRRIVIGKKEDGNKEWRFVSGTFVNKDKLLEVPQDYYDKDET
jgi:hypothetical protein